MHVISTSIDYEESKMATYLVMDVRDLYFIKGCSSYGRALALHARGTEFNNSLFLFPLIHTWFNVYTKIHAISTSIDYEESKMATYLVMDLFGTFVL